MKPCEFLHRIPRCAWPELSKHGIYNIIGVLFRFHKLLTFLFRWNRLFSWIMWSYYKITLFTVSYKTYTVYTRFINNINFFFFFKQLIKWIVAFETSNFELCSLKFQTPLDYPNIVCKTNWFRFRWVILIRGDLKSTRKEFIRRNRGVFDMVLSILDWNTLILFSYVFVPNLVSSRSGV